MIGCMKIGNAAKKWNACKDAEKSKDNRITSGKYKKKPRTEV